MTNSSRLSFKGKIDKSPGEGGWHFVFVPSETHLQLREQAKKTGNVPVLVTIGKTTFSTTTMSMGQQRWFFAVKAEVRKAENLAEGDAVSVKVAPDPSRLPHLAA